MRKLYRSRYNKKIAGICGGLGSYFSIDPNFIRILVIFISVLTVLLPIFLVYLIASLFIPLEPASMPAIDFKRLYRSRKNRFIGGICGGAAQFFNIDPSVLRLLFVVVTFITGLIPMLITYLVGLAVIPEKNL